MQCKRNAPPLSPPRPTPTAKAVDWKARKRYEPVETTTGGSCASGPVARKVRGAAAADEPSKMDQ